MRTALLIAALAAGTALPAAAQSRPVARGYAVARDCREQVRDRREDVRDRREDRRDRRRYTGPLDRVEDVADRREDVRDRREDRRDRRRGPVVCS